MQTKSFYFLFLIASAATFFHCKDKDEPVLEESPLLTFFDEPGIFVDTTESSGTIWDYGFEINPLTSGRITKLGVRVPKPGDYQVVLWDISGANPVQLRSATITIGASDIHTSKFATITPVQVAKDARLVVSILSPPYYRMTKLNGDKFTFPREVGNLRIVTFLESENTSGMTTLPQTKNETRVAPCVNVIFIAD